MIWPCHYPKEVVTILLLQIAENGQMWSVCGESGISIMRCHLMSAFGEIALAGAEMLVQKEPGVTKFYEL